MWKCKFSFSSSWTHLITLFPAANINVSITYNHSKAFFSSIRNLSWTRNHPFFSYCFGRWTRPFAILWIFPTGWLMPCEISGSGQTWTDRLIFQTAEILRAILCNATLPFGGLGGNRTRVLIPHTTNSTSYPVSTLYAASWTGYVRCVLS